MRKDLDHVKWNTSIKLLKDCSNTKMYEIVNLLLEDYPLFLFSVDFSEVANAECFLVLNNLIKYVIINALTNDIFKNVIYCLKYFLKCPYFNLCILYKT